MSNVTAIQQLREEPLSNETMLALAAGGDCKSLSPGQRLAYVKARCEAAGLDPVTHPFEFTNLNGKLVLYAKKAATDGLSAKHSTSITLPSAKVEAGVYTVIAHASDPAGRQMEDMGCVWVEGMKGADLANAMMKATTKAKRRAVLSMYGLGMLDETEVAEIQAGERHPAPAPTHATATAAPVVEVLPPEPPKTKAPPPYVLALWNRVREQFGREKAPEKFKEAAEVLGNKKPTSEWSLPETQDVERFLFPTEDIPF